MQKAAHAYFQTQVTTTSQGELLVMLYDGAIKFLNKAKELIAANDMGGKGIYISKALDIIHELDSTLNIEKGGDLAANLHNLYFFCNSRLLMANLKKSPEIIDEVLMVLTGIRSAYAEIITLPEAKAAGQEAAASQHATAIMPPRAQAGMSLGNMATPVPGAAARVRNMYARRAAELEQRFASEKISGENNPDKNTTPVSASFPTTGPAASFGTGSPSFAATPAPGLKTSPLPPAPPTVQGSTGAVTPGAPTLPSDPVNAAPQAAGLPLQGGGFSKAMAGSSLYRKFAGQ